MNEVNKKSRLGRGLSSIFNKKQDYQIKNTSFVDINLIHKNPFQPRISISEKELKELAESIKTYGLIQPITVRPTKNNYYELISGERRLRACILGGLKKIPVFIKDVKNNQMLEVALVENIQRQDLDPIEIALSLDHLIKDYHFTQETLAKKIGKSRSTISNYIRLLKLDPIIQAGIRDKIITIGHAKAIMNIDDPNIQLNIYQDIIRKKLSVRDTEVIVKNTKLTSTLNKVQNRISLSNHYQKIENTLSTFFNQNVKLRISKNGKGKIEIPFSSENKLDEIIKLLQS